MNVNDPVYVRLTEAGKAALEGYFEEFDLRMQEYSIPNAGVLLRDLRRMVDAQNGWYVFQLWELMYIFGSKCFNGAPQLFVKSRVVTRKPEGAVRYIDTLPMLTMF